MSSLRADIRAWRHSIEHSTHPLAAALLAAQTVGLGVALVVSRDHARYSALVEVMPRRLWGLLFLVAGVWFGRAYARVAGCRVDAEQGLWVPVVSTATLWVCLCVAYTASLGATTALPMYGCGAVSLFAVLTLARLPERTRRAAARRRRTPRT